MTQIRRSLVLVGELPEPFGGVAMHCDNVCTELSRRGVDVHFLDSEPGSVKHLPPLASYSRVTGRYVRGGLSALRSPRVVRSWFGLVVPVAHKIGPRRLPPGAGPRPEDLRDGTAGWNTVHRRSSCGGAWTVRPGGRQSA